MSGSLTVTSGTRRAIAWAAAAVLVLVIIFAFEHGRLTERSEALERSPLRRLALTPAKARAIAQELRTLAAAYADAGMADDAQRTRRDSERWFVYAATLEHP